MATVKQVKVIIYKFSVTQHVVNKADYFNEQLPRVTTPQPEAGLG